MLQLAWVLRVASHFLRAGAIQVQVPAAAFGHRTELVQQSER